MANLLQQTMSQKEAIVVLFYCYWLWCS